MGEAASNLRMSPEEYLALERSSDTRHEYANGEVFAMAGGTRARSLIAVNLGAELRAALADRPCEVHSTERYDRSEKFAQYRALGSLSDYVLVSQHQAQIEIFTRAERGIWHYRALGAGERLELPSIGCSIEVDRVYTKVFDRPA